MTDGKGASAIVLAGGKSTRLGRDKASEPLLGRTLLQRAVDRLAGLVDEVIVVRAASQTLPPLEPSPASIVVVEDVYPETGPLGGVYSGLVASKAWWAVAVACDMPLLRPAFVAELLRLAPGEDAVVPLNEDGLPEPLCAVYAKPCLTAMHRHLEAGVYKLAALFEAVRPRYVPPAEWRRFDPDGLSFLNLNREEDLRRAAALIEAEAAAGQR